MKKLLYYFIILLLYFSFIINSTASVLASGDEIPNTLPAHKSGELLVKLKDSQQIYKFKFNNGEDLDRLIKFYNSQPEVEYVEPNYLYQATMEPLDTYYTQQIYLTQIKAHLAWNITTGDNKITIAVIDSGVDIDHPDLKENIWTNSREIPNNGIDDDENGFTDDVHGWDFITNSNDPQPKFQDNYSVTAVDHGTVVAGVAAAQGGNRQGIAGVSWRAKIMPLRALNERGVGDTLTVAKAIDYARRQGADIINLSFVGEGKSITLENAIKNAYEAGILVVAAAGNEVSSGIDMDKHPQYPVCDDGPNGENWVIGVASVDKDDRLSSFSNFGKNCIDLSAPGVGIFSTTYQNSNYPEFKKYYKSGWTGTSVSAPQVAGAAALIKSLKPNLSLKQIRDLLLNNTDNIDSKNKNYQKLIGTGRLNVYAALSKTIIEKPVHSIQISEIITSPAKNGGPHIRIFKKANVESQFFAFDEKFRGNLSIAGGDINNDGSPEIIIGLGAGTYPWVKIFTPAGILKNRIVAYAENFRGGVEVAVGDVDGDGQLEIITGAGKGGGPHVRIFSSKGILEGQFFAFNKNERTGIEVATGDVNQDGRDEIIVARKSGLSQVKVFNFRGQELASFMAYAPNFKGGVHLASGDLDGDGRDEIITGAGAGGGPHVRVFEYTGKVKSQFYAYAKNFHGGAYVAVGDVDGDGQLEIITGAGPSGGPHVRIFNLYGGVKMQFFSYDKRFRGGVRVAVEK